MLRRFLEVPSQSEKAGQSPVYDKMSAKMARFASNQLDIDRVIDAVSIPTAEVRERAVKVFGYWLRGRHLWRKMLDWVSRRDYRADYPELFRAEKLDARQGFEP